MSTNTIVGEMIAEHDAKQRKQPLPTPKEVHARMIEMTNAANGLRYEVARFGDIERQLKAVHEKMEPLVLKAKELNDLVCERVSQASQPWANSCIHDAEELMQKVQQLEHENVALRADVLEQCMLIAKGSEREYSLRGRIEQLERENAALRSLIDDPNAMHSHYLRECNGWEVWRAERVRGLERENESLIEDVRGLEPMVDRLERENAALRADAERYRYIKNSETMEVSEILQSFCVSITFDLDAAIDAARAKEAQP